MAGGRTDGGGGVSRGGWVVDLALGSSAAASQPGWAARVGRAHTPAVPAFAAARRSPGALRNARPVCPAAPPWAGRVSTRKMSGDDLAPGARLVITEHISAGRRGRSTPQDTRQSRTHLRAIQAAWRQRARAPRAGYTPFGSTRGRRLAARGQGKHRPARVLGEQSTARIRVHGNERANERTGELWSTGSTKHTRFCHVKGKRGPRFSQPRWTGCSFGATPLAATGCASRR